MSEYQQMESVDPEEIAATQAESIELPATIDESSATPLVDADAIGRQHSQPADDSDEEDYVNVEQDKSPDPSPATEPETQPQDEPQQQYQPLSEPAPLNGLQEDAPATQILVDEYKDPSPDRGSSEPFLSPASPSILSESKRALLNEEDGTVIRFGNYEVSYEKQREIFCSTNVTLLSVDLRSQTFDVEMDMRFYWQQPEIEEDIPFEATWTIYDDGKSLPCDPDDLFEHDVGVDWIQQEFHYNRKTKVVEWQCQFRDTFSERMELHRFPVDRQFLNIKLQGRVKAKEGNWVWVVQPPAWVPPKRWYCLRSRLGQSISDYELFEPWADFRVIVDDDLNDNAVDEQPPFKLRLRVQRYTSYYLGNINIPMFLIVAVCLVSLVMPPDNMDLANRLSVTVTSMLAGVAFRFVVSDMLPPVNYLTLMDYYVGVSFFMVSMFILENAVATIVEDTLGEGKLVDFWFGGGLMIMWVVINGGFFYACWSNTFRVSWDLMDLEDRLPSELDHFKESPAGQTRGEEPDNPMAENIIQMAMMKQITT